MNLAKNLERSAFYFPNRPVIGEAGVDISYAEFNSLANKVATALIKMGIQPGDHVALCAANSAQWLAFYFGALKAGATAVTLPHMLKEDELKLLVNHSKPRIIFTQDDKIDILEKLKDKASLQTIVCDGGDLSFNRLTAQGVQTFQALDRQRWDTAAILYTGGTTGVPKGVMLSHANINAAIHGVMFLERTTPMDRALCFLPLNHVFGQMHVMNTTVLSGGCVELMPVFDMEQVLTALGTGKITKFFAVPTVYVRFLSFDDLKAKLGGVRYSFSAAASMAAEIVRQWKARTGLDICEGYGMTEAAPTVSYNHYHRHVVGSVGTEVPGVEIQIRDAEGQVLPQGEKGEICVRGPNVMKGYLDNPEGTQQAFWQEGWFRTGDVGMFDPDGYLYIVDRIKDMIITGGENVYSTEVEEVLYRHPKISECAIIGLPDMEWGERVVACIIPKENATVGKKELYQYLKDRLAAYKVPKEFLIMEDFPRSAAGKVLKRNLRDSFLSDGQQPDI